MLAPSTGVPVDVVNVPSSWPYTEVAAAEGYSAVTAAASSSCSDRSVRYAIGYIST
jgi:hypothetical protein